MSLKVPPLTKQHTAPSLSRSREDDDIDTDLEASFRSSMSLYPVTPAPVQHAPRHISLAGPIPMDISPAQPVTFNARPRSFGRELVNTVTNEILARNLLKATPDKPISKLSTAKSGTTSNKARQRAGLPTQWMQPSTPASVNMANASSLGSPMDVDSPAPRQPSPRPKRSYEQLDPLPNPRKRRSTEPEQTAPPPPQPPTFSLELDPPSSSPSVPKHHRKFDRFASSGLVLPLAATNSGVDNSNERKSRRPTLATLSNPPQSAYPILEQPGEEPKEVKFSAALPPPRRAFSAVQPTFLAPFGAGDISLSSDESFGQSSPAAAYAKRTNQRVLRRKDGTEEFRPKNTPSPAQGGSSPVPCAMPPFGAEAQGKILPCTSVREDGLMRINSHTLAQMLKGQYDTEISSYKIFDCRFDYEFTGGHILGATNVNSTAGIEETLLTPNGFLPDASSSGDGKSKVVLIFHCEFSLHRAPTIAKHLRAKDRAMNNHNYPRVHYPEVYILNGGYSQFFKDYPNFCEPRAYVRMNEAGHETKCEGGLDNFRKGKWGRTRSYTYGDVHARSRPNSLQGASLAKPPSNRNTAPSGAAGVPSLFAAANAARSRRVGGLAGPEESTLAPLAENDHDHEANTSGSGMDSECIEESPCPPTGTHRYSSQMMKMKASHY